MARKPDQVRITLAVLVWTVLLSVGRLCAQDVLTANPEIWGLDAHSANATCGTEQGSTLSPNSAVVANAQLRGILKTARRAERQGKNTEAQRLYGQAIQLAPTDRIALLSYARLLHRIGDFDGSVSLYYRSLENHRDDPVAMNDLALCYARKGELRHALAMMNGAVSLHPDSKRYRNNLAKLLLELGQPKEAFAQLVAAGGPAIGHFNMGQMLNQRGRVAEAVQYLEIAVEMDPSLRPAIDLLREIRSTRATPTAEVARLPKVDVSTPTLDELTGVDAIFVADTATPELPSLPAVESAPTKPTSTELIPDKRRQPGLDRPWSPGSIKLQSAALEKNAGDERVHWAAAIDGLDQQGHMIAPIPFESPFDVRRYTEPVSNGDAIGSFLEKLEAADP